jgi:NAD(P)H-dependent FMN reductase
MVGPGVRILAVSGSLDPGSSNHALLRLAAGAVAAPSVGVLPHFSPTVDADDAVAAWRSAVEGADAVLIASPEYAHSLPGSLKNALDWLVGSGELYGKPVAVLAATPRPGGGALGRAALEQTLRAQGADVRWSASVFVRRGTDPTDDPEARSAVAAALASL